jgi:hypothetical protein
MMGDMARLLQLCSVSPARWPLLLSFQSTKTNPPPTFPKGVTINAIVSALATVSKGALLLTTSSCLGQLKWIWYRAEQPRNVAHARIFDDASSGPLGALFLFASGSRKSTASLGVILTLLALAYDPFVQQVISISPEVRYGLSNDVTTKQATRSIMRPTNLQSQQALTAGIYTDGFGRSPSCLTGNCTFPSFSSVGWCSQCSQPSDWHFVDGCSLIFQDTDFDLEGPDDDWSFGANRTCTLVSQSGHSQDIMISAVGAIGASVARGDTDYTAELELFQTTTEFQPVSILSSLVSTPPDSRFPWGGRVPMGQWAMATFKIANWSLAVDSVDTCTLDLCLRDYNVTVTGGTTRAVASNERFGRRYFRNGKNFSEIAWQQASQEIDALPYLCWEPDGSPKNSSWTHEKVDDNYDLYVSPSDYAICMPSASLLWNWSPTIAPMVVGNWSTSTDFGAGGSSVDNGTFHFDSTNMLLGWDNLAGSFQSYNGSATVSDRAYDAVDIDETRVNVVTIKQLGLETVMSNIAASLTQLGLKDPSVNEITGKIGTVETVAHVRWEWPALPGFLPIGITFFLSSRSS